MNENRRMVPVLGITMLAYQFLVELPPEGQRSEEKFKSETDVRIQSENKDFEHHSCYSVSIELPLWF